MKGFLTILFFLSAVVSQAQITQYIGAPNTTLENKGYQKINKTPEDSGATIIPMVIDTVTHKVGTRKLGINVDGPYLQGIPGSTVYDRDHIRFNPDSAQRYSNAATIVENLNLDYPTWEDILNVDSVRITGSGTSKTVTTYFHNGTTSVGPWIDLTGGSYTASNGDTLVGTDIQLGGSLSHDVLITTNGNEYRMQTAPQADGTTGVEFILSVTGKIWNEAWDYTNLSFKHDIWTSVSPSGVQLYADNFGSTEADALGNSEIDVLPSKLQLVGAGGNIILGDVGANPLPSYADNAAAIAGGMEIGSLYQSGDYVKRVH